MDHLTNLSNPVCPIPIVAFIEIPDLAYQGSISTFKEQIRKAKPDITSQPDHRCSCLVQQWLYFGVLAEFFAIWGFEVPQSDFITLQNASKSITNRLLADYMVAVTVQEFNQNQSLLRDKRPTNTTAAYTLKQKKEAEARMDRGLEIFRFVHSCLQPDVVDEMAVDAPIWDSIILLSASLIRFWQILYGSIRPETVSYLTPDFSSFHFRSITDMRSNKHFCKHEQKLILSLVDGRPNDIAFFSLLGPNEDEKSHDKCTENECKAYQVEDKKVYTTVHDVDCDGSCAFVGLNPYFWMSKLEERRQKDPPQEGFAQSLYKKLPDYISQQTEAFSKQAVAVTFEDNKLVTHDVRLVKAKAAGWFDRHFEDGTMVAFSHVWADGLGNPGSNTLPSCQLKRLQNLANSAYDKPKGNVPFWFDTLLIPVNRTDLPDEKVGDQEEAKTVALRDMEWAYKFASKVLVLDKRLFTVNSTNMEPEEIGARIMCSVWSRRLWTLQEGCNKNKTLFKFRDRWIHWPDLHEQVLDRGGLSNWKKKGSKVPKGHPLADKFSIDPFANKKGGSSLDSYQGAASNGLTMPLVEAKIGANKRLYKVTSQNWHSIYRFLEELTIDWSGSARAAALPRCVRGMYYRNCSRQEDEALVLASMISATPGLAAKLTQQSANKVDQRYKILLTSLKEVPEDLLFLDQRRYGNEDDEIDEDEGSGPAGKKKMKKAVKKGSGWIPKSLLSASAPDYQPPTRSDALPKRHSLTPKYLRRRTSVLCTRTDEGIELGLRGLKLLPCPRAIPAPFKFKWENSTFNASLKRPGESGEEALLNDLPPDHYALIFERVAGFSSDWFQARAALVRITEWFSTGWKGTTGGKGEFIALATVIRVEHREFEESELPLIEVEEPATKFYPKIRALEPNGRQGPLQKWIVG